MKEEIKENNSLQNNDSSTVGFRLQEPAYSKISQEAIKYIHTEKRYVILSIIFPIFIIGCQIANLILISLNFQEPPPPQPGKPPIFDFTTPILIFTIITVFMLIHLIYLLSWNSKVKKYIKYESTRVDYNIDKNHSDENESSNYISLSQVLYDIVNHMRKIRLIFFALNVVCILYLVWLIRLLLMRMLDIVGFITHFPLPLLILNSIAQVLMMIYLGILWRYYLKWNRKLLRLEAFEKEVYEELEIESEV